jgi:hypothetical protein
MNQDFGPEPISAQDAVIQALRNSGELSQPPPTPDTGAKGGTPYSYETVKAVWLKAYGRRDWNDDLAYHFFHAAVAQAERRLAASQLRISELELVLTANGFIVPRKNEP